METRVEENHGGHTIITSLHPDGEPKSPKGVKMTVVNQCGCYVRDHIPISFKLWKKSKATDIDAPPSSSHPSETLVRRQGGVN